MSLLSVEGGSASSLSSAQRVEAELRRAIVSMEMPPGTRLSEQEIALRHGVSRQPVREALIALARSRLVDIMPQRGTVVVKFSSTKMREARFVREAVECAVVRQAAQNFSVRSRDRIAELLVLQDMVAERGDHASFQRYDEAFHIELMEGAGLGLAWESIRDIKAHMDRVCHLTLPGQDSMIPLIAQHRAVMAAIEACDPDAAEAAMRLHLTEILRALPKAEASNPDLFE